MAQYSDDDPYLDEASCVLKNKLGILEQEELDQAEASLVATRSYQIQQNPVKGDFDLKHLQVIHKHLFGDVYEWAGELRIIDISKRGNMFAHHQHIESAAAPIFHELAKEERLAGLDQTALSSRAAHYLGELNALHPFREGDGRTQREFISQIAQESGYYIAWEQIKETDMLQSSVASFRGDLAQLCSLIEQNLHPFDRDEAAQRSFY